jgi:hypothetical protein
MFSRSLGSEVIIMQVVSKNTKIQKSASETQQLFHFNEIWINCHLGKDFKKISQTQFQWPKKLHVYPHIQ